MTNTIKAIKISSGKYHYRGFDISCNERISVNKWGRWEIQARGEMLSICRQTKMFHSMAEAKSAVDAFFGLK